MASETALQSEIWKALNWNHIVNAVKHDMFPLMATSMESAVESLRVDQNSLTVDKLDDDAVQRVIDKMHQKRKLSTKEVEHIKMVVQRARDYTENGDGGS